MAGAERVGEHKTSVLEDLEVRRLPRVRSARVGAVVELGERLNPPMQNRRTVYSCLMLLAQRSAPPSTAPK
jgi:2-dehydropantoate 2-reductase